jgi:hypothetical protein
MEKKPISSLFNSWKDFCQYQLGDDHEDVDELPVAPSIIPPKTKDKGMPRELPTDEHGFPVLPKLDGKFKAAVPGFVRQEMLRSWMTYWYSKKVYLLISPYLH